MTERKLKGTLRRTITCTPDVHEDSINRAAAAGFAAGSERAAFAPGLEVSRAQIATFLARMLDRLAEEATTTA